VKLSVVDLLIKLKGGENKEIILLTVKCFKKFCLKASTQQSEKIYDYYIKMEEIIIKYIENKHNQMIEENNNKGKLLLLKDNQIEENIIMLQLKDHEIENSHKKLQLKDQELDFKNQEIDNKDKLLEVTLTNLQIKDIEIKNLKNQTYEEIDKNNHIYIFTTDKPNIYKCGRTNDIKKSFITNWKC